ncbi:dienelactone hydrolase family protein [Actinokineospora pegani]|uniref:dienelactone hydrolase family protein n=1 Tax=Actinokineospora pegani TaxID=2654637 RepID=UPI0018D4ADEA|nr:dienelactone hydrolase family protein [Actinokineospora pegani]
MSTTTVTVPGTECPADVWVPEGARAVVVVVPGATWTRHGPETQALIAALHGEGLATVVADVHPHAEAERRFAVTLLTDRLAAAVTWVREEMTVGPVGLLVEGIGAGAALSVAAQSPTVSAVVSVNGRPELARHPVEQVRSPVLMLVDGVDPAVAELNRTAAAAMAGRAGVRVVSGATGQEVAGEAAEWLARTMSDGLRQRGGPEGTHDSGG